MYYFHDPVILVNANCRQFCRLCAWIFQYMVDRKLNSALVVLKDGIVNNFDIISHDVNKRLEKI